MKTKVEKRLRYLAAGIFFMALVLNVKFTLDSPYFLSVAKLVAETTGTDTGTYTDTGIVTSITSCWDSKVYKCVKDVDCMRTVQFAMDAGGKWG